MAIFGDVPNIGLGPEETSSLNPSFVFTMYLSNFCFSLIWGWFLIIRLPPVKNVI